MDWNFDLPVQIRRLMEEDNKKARKAKRRKFNETVRELISFVKKRDKRVAAHQVKSSDKSYIVCHILTFSKAFQKQSL